MAFQLLLLLFWRAAATTVRITSATNCGHDTMITWEPSASVIVAPALVRAVPPEGMVWVLAGGLVYSAGALVYGLKLPNPVPGVFGCGLRCRRGAQPRPEASLFGP
jgi:hypothetical protein